MEGLKEARLSFRGALTSALSAGGGSVPLAGVESSVWCSRGAQAVLDPELRPTHWLLSCCLGV